MHVDLAGGAHTRRGAPGEFFLGSGFCERDQLLRDMQPFAVIALPDTFGELLVLRERGADADQKEQ